MMLEGGGRRMDHRLKGIFKIFRGLYKAVLRFPFTILCLLCSTALTCYMISLDRTPELIIQKLMFLFLVGSFLGVTAQFICERFRYPAGKRAAAYVLAALLTLGYYLIILPAPAIDYSVGARTFVAVFSLFCAFNFAPSIKNKYDFNSVALIHFKSVFTSVLYSGVLTAGLSAIIFAVDTLLVNVDNDFYSYMMAIVWILFATVYYLSLLPQFNSEEESDRAYAGEAGKYPRFLEILVSYIAIPLIAVYTLVLAAYFIKIGITMKWPSGQLGPMILSYSAVGLIVHILAGRLENRFAVLYKMIFPKALIPTVVMQLISVYIRLRSYGVTESRYYLILFGIFSIVAGLMLSFTPSRKNGVIAVLAACFALFSVIPPLDAFTVSRDSQIKRLENILTQSSILESGKIKPKADANMDSRIETTNILNYLERRNYKRYVAWLPADFEMYKDMKDTFGFEPTYKNMGEYGYSYISLNAREPMDVKGFDVILQAAAYRGIRQQSDIYDFSANGAQYHLVLERLSPQDVRLFVQNDAGAILADGRVYEFASSIAGVNNRPKEALDADNLTMDVKGDGCTMRVVFKSINIDYGSGEYAGADYDMFIMVAVPSK